MYKGFQLSRIKPMPQYESTGKHNYLNQKKIITNQLNQYLDYKEVLDGTLMQKDWFPSIHADIFLSHSHADEDLAIQLAGWLKEKLELEVFIDSCVWGYSGELLYTIDEQYCTYKRDGKKLYNYKKRNESTSHVHMMLATALAKMIDKTECLFFLNTPNSVTVQDSVNRTFSPWIYYEIATSKVVNKHRDESNRLSMTVKTALLDENKIPLTYELNLKNLTALSAEDLCKWKDICKNHDYRGKHVLDALYFLKSEKGV